MSDFPSSVWHLHLAVILIRLYEGISGSWFKCDAFLCLFIVDSTAGQVATAFTLTTLTNKHNDIYILVCLIISTKLRANTQTALMHDINSMICTRMSFYKHAFDVKRCFKIKYFVKMIYTNECENKIQKATCVCFMMVVFLLQIDLCSASSRWCDVISVWIRGLDGSSRSGSSRSHRISSGSAER